MIQIPLTQKQFAIVDDDMALILRQMKWFARYEKNTRSFYAVRNSSRSVSPRRTEFLHWYVIGFPMKDFVVDHINGDTLDNRRQNLRIVTHRTNQLNRKQHRQGRLAGTTYDKKSCMWRSQLWIDKKCKWLGEFLTEQEAHQRYLVAKKQFIGG